MLSVSPYWRRGYSDEQWRSIEAGWLREVEQDVLDTHRPATGG